MKKHFISRFKASLVLFAGGLIIGCLLLTSKLLPDLAGETEKFSPDDDALYIAVIGPMSGRNKIYGEEMARGVSFCLDRINKEGGVNKKKVRLVRFDDQGDPKFARKRASELAENPNILLAIGHLSSKNSIEGGNIYQAAGVPAITGSATSDDVTQGNDWYFRVIFNNRSQGVFLANYVKEILNRDVVSIIYDQNIYGASLAGAFKDTFRDAGGTVGYERSFDPKAENLDEIIEEISKDVEKKADTGMIFLATHSDAAVKLIVSIRRKGINAPIIGGDTIGDSFFAGRFREYPEEQSNPGYFSDGVYSVAPVIFDVASSKIQRFRSAFSKKYGQESSWVAIAYYEAALTAVHAMKMSGIQGKPGELKEDRRKIRDALAGLNGIEHSLEGIMGNISFDKHGTVERPLAIGFFQNQNFISALTQLQPMGSFNRIFNPGEELKADRILSFNERYIYKTNVVYTGMEIHEIADFDAGDLSCTLDFSLWFRYRGKFDPANIQFLNAAEPVSLKKPSYEEKNEQFTYRLYRVKGRFKADFLSIRPVFGEHIIGLSFRHKELTRNNLIYVTDMLGMGLTPETSLHENLNQAHALNPASGWTLTQTWLFQDIEEKHTQGKPRHLNLRKKRADYSRFNFGIGIRKNTFSFRKLIYGETAKYLLVLGCILSVLTLLIREKHKSGQSSKLLWFLRMTLTFLILLSGEGFVLDWLRHGANTYYLELTVLVFDILWWAVPAIFLHLVLERFVWRPLEKRTSNVIPNLVRRMAAFLIYTVAFFGIIAFVFNQRLTGLLATSGVVAMIIGLAIQVNISNIFSGLAINLERPFRVGDWVKIGSLDVGKVVDINWRTTRIEVGLSNICSIPNSTAAESVIVNYHYPDDTFMSINPLYINSDHSPERVRKILCYAAMSAEGVLETPGPGVQIRGVRDRCAEYCVTAWYRDYGKRIIYADALWNSIWKHLDRAGIEFAIQGSNIQFSREAVKKTETNHPLSLLQKAEVFSPLSEESKLSLSKQMQQHYFPPNTTIIRQEDPGDSLFIVSEGVVSVRLQLEQEKFVELARMGAGDIIGEMAILTGESRTATLVSVTETTIFEIAKTDIDPFIKKHPEMAGYLSKMLTERKTDTETKKTASHELQETEKKHIYSDTFHKIQGLFGLRKG